MLDQLIATSTFGIGYADNDGKTPTICVSRRQGDAVQCTVLPLAEFLDKVFAGFVPDPEMSKKLMEMQAPAEKGPVTREMFKNLVERRAPGNWVPAFPETKTKETPQ
jgi:hypothetical protein